MPDINSVDWFGWWERLRDYAVSRGWGGDAASDRASGYLRTVYRICWGVCCAQEQWREESERFEREDQVVRFDCQRLLAEIDAEIESIRRVVRRRDDLEELKRRQGDGPDEMPI